LQFNGSGLALIHQFADSPIGRWQASDNVPVTLESRLDELYQLPLAEFTAARNALAKTLTGAEAARVKALPKPTVVPWAINQLYWRDRRTYDRLLKTGGALRDAQIAALKGRHGDVRRATEQHRAAVADAVRSATALAAPAGAHPAADQLARMLEAISLSPERADAPGRFAALIQPSGFEALAGIAMKPGAGSLHIVPGAAPARPLGPGDGGPAAREAKAHAGSRDEAPASGGAGARHHAAPAPSISRAEQRKLEAERKREEAERARAEAARRRDAQAAVRKAEHELATAEAALARANREVEQTEAALAAVRARHEEALKVRDRARTTLARAREAASFA
jgi:hypothetical protein